ncbi:MAG: serine acetyltransferase [Actinomycetota bacterium]
METVCVCEGVGLREAIREDLDRYVYIVGVQHDVKGPLTPLRVGLLSQGLWATTAYRVNHHARYRLHSRLIGVLPAIAHRVMTALTGIQIDVQAHIGPGLKIPHGGKIVVGPVRIGRNCDLFQGVTLGGGMSMTTVDDRDSSPGPPTLGNRVWVGPGAVIAGDVTVGDDVAVGANSLLVRNVPSRAVVVGVPARVVSRRGSFAQIAYRGMDDDAERAAALAEDSEAGPVRRDSQNTFNAQ